MTEKKLLKRRQFLKGAARRFPARPGAQPTTLAHLADLRGVDAFHPHALTGNVERIAINRHGATRDGDQRRDFRTHGTEEERTAAN